MPDKDPRRRPKHVGDDHIHAEPNPMDEENFPDNPTRRAADREMHEATNIPGSKPEPMHSRKHEVEDEDG